MVSNWTKRLTQCPPKRVMPQYQLTIVVAVPIDYVIHCLCNIAQLYYAFVFVTYDFVYEATINFQSTLIIESLSWSNADFPLFSLNPSSFLNLLILSCMALQSSSSYDLIVCCDFDARLLWRLLSVWFWSVVQTLPKHHFPAGLIYNLFFYRFRIYNWDLLVFTQFTSCRSYSVLFSLNIALSILHDISLIKSC